MLLKQTQPLVIQGFLVNTEGRANYGYVLVQNGRIMSVSSAPPMLSEDVILLKPGNDCFIYPGFVDLHTHSDYNLLPMWNNPYPNIWDNRFEWRNNSDYKKAISDPIAYVRDHWQEQLRGTNDGPIVGVAFQCFSELQAVAGGTTVLQENTSLTSGAKVIPRRHVLIRNTGVAADMGFPEGHEVDSQTDFYKPSPTPLGQPNQDTSSWKCEIQDGFNDYLKRYASEAIMGTLVHLAEGRSGAGLYKKGVDAYSRNEFQAFMQQIQPLKPEQVIKTHINLIHGCGMNAWDTPTKDFLCQYRVGLVWSPVSNMLLYGDTSFAPAFWYNGVNVSLGSDWSPSGSKHVWDEAKYARIFFQLLGIPVGDLKLFQLITTNPAAALNIPAGRIEPGCFGDFFILRNPFPGLNPLETLFQCDDADTRAVICGGIPAYGDPDIFKAWKGEIIPQQLSSKMGKVAAQKAVNFPLEVGVDVIKDFNHMVALFASQGVDHLSLPLSIDDIYYQKAIQDLKAYTVWYARQIGELPSDKPVISRTQLRGHALDALVNAHRQHVCQ